jgi:hypothetical protein
MKKLQPLRIPARWTVSWNSFHEEDPDEAHFIAFDGGTLFAADFNLDAATGIAIDMEWSPKDLKQGRFVASYIRYSRRDKRESTLLGQFATRDRMEMAAELERFMRTLEPPADGARA